MHFFTPLLLVNNLQLTPFFIYFAANTVYLK